MGTNPLIPEYRDAKTVPDLNHNMNVLIMTFNHSITSIKDDVHWMKRIMWGVLGVFVSILIAAVCDMMGWVPA